VDAPSIVGMTNAQVVALGVRLFCIWLALFIVRHAPALWSLNTQQFPDSGAAGAVIIVSVVLIVVTIALWFFPLAVARKLIPKATLDQPTPLPIDQLQSAGFCLLGLWVLTEAVPRLVYIIFIVYHSTRPNAMVALEPHNYAAIAQTIVELGIGSWLLFGAKGLLRAIRWARTAGTGEPSNNLAESDVRQEPRAPHHGR
jgi:hypothetical protein